ncbi:MAG: UDP-N-acetylmuramoyl-L-alanine--D-glutamate ligase [Gemmatimonadales bacterium]
MTLFERWRADGREVAVVGLARSGTAAAHLLRREGIAVYASDTGTGPEIEARVAPIRARGATIEVGGHDLARIARAQALVVSPGVPPDAPPVQAARAAGVPVVSEIEVGAAALPGVRFAAITGTNGKTTTTALAAHLLAGTGHRAVAAGNIGTPLSELAVRGERPEWVALEVSSFQLHDTHDLIPACGVLTNLAPDHLDRYSSIAEYYADKQRLFRSAHDGSCWILNADDSEVVAMARGVAGRRRLFSVEQRADASFDRGRSMLRLGEADLLLRKDLLLLGDHNVANALAAALVAAEAGAQPSAIARALATFRALPHRLEPVREVDGVLWINDSKATNVASTAVALEAVDRPYVLLLGGRHKGEAYTSLADRMEGRCKAVIAFGESREIIERDLGGRVKVIPGGSFADVMGRAKALAARGDAVLLSPACSSYDMFKNYEDRGAQFRAAVEAF